MSAEPRPLPASIDAEKGVLCSVLLNPANLPAIDLRAEDFHHPAHGTIWRAFHQLSVERKAIDLITVTQTLADFEKLDQVGGPAYLAELQTFLPTAKNHREYSFAIRQKADLRKVIRAAEKALQSLYEPGADAGEILESTMESLKPIRSDASAAPVFCDLTPYLDGTLEQERPTVAETFDGKHLFYAGRLNEIHAEPATGKTNVLLAASIAVFEAGGSILYIDPEDTPRGFTARLLALGASPDDIKNRTSYLHNPTPEEITAAQLWARDKKPNLVILDGLAESMASVGADENQASDVLLFFRQNLRPFAESGAAVVIADHVTKSTEGRGQFARGSGAKAGRYDGVSYEVVRGNGYTPDQAGFVRLKIAKDRNGGVGPRGMIAAELHFTPRQPASFRESLEKQEGPFRPTAIMEKIRKHLEVFKEDTKRGLRDLGNHSAAETAIRIMLEEGQLEMTLRGRSQIFSLKKTP